MVVLFSASLPFSLDWLIELTHSLFLSLHITRYSKWRMNDNNNQNKEWDVYVFIIYLHLWKYIHAWYTIYTSYTSAIRNTSKDHIQYSNIYVYIYICIYSQINWLGRTYSNERYLPSWTRKYFHFEYNFRIYKEWMNELKLRLKLDSNHHRNENDGRNLQCDSIILHRNQNRNTKYVHQLVDFMTFSRFRPRESTFWKTFCDALSLHEWKGMEGNGIESIQWIQWTPRTIARFLQKWWKVLCSYCRIIHSTGTN